jgi:hypothetical protein
MKIITDTLSFEELRQMAEGMFGNMVKGVVDIDRDLLALDSQLHSDLEAFLIQDGSEQKSLWGINLYPDELDENFIEFDSMINVRPSQNNRSRGVESEEIRQMIVAIVGKRIQR